MNTPYTATEMQSSTSPWTEAYQASSQRPEQSTNRSQAMAEAQLADDESARPTHEALDYIYNLYA